MAELTIFPTPCYCKRRVLNENSLINERGSPVVHSTKYCGDILALYEDARVPGFPVERQRRKRMAT